MCPELTESVVPAWPRAWRSRDQGGD